jgi:hypothetical protein
MGQRFHTERCRSLLVMRYCYLGSDREVERTVVKMRPGTRGERYENCDLMGVSGIGTGLGEIGCISNFKMPLMSQCWPEDGRSAVVKLVGVKVCVC